MFAAVMSAMSCTVLACDVLACDMAMLPALLKLVGVQDIDGVEGPWMIGVEGPLIIGGRGWRAAEIEPS
jgi:hypothetical protein